MTGELVDVIKVLRSVQAGLQEVAVEGGEPRAEGDAEGEGQSGEGEAAVP